MEENNATKSPEDGADLDSLNPQSTFIIGKNHPLQRILHSEMSDEADGDARAAGTDITLVIRNLRQPIHLTEDKPVTLGRLDTGTGFQPDVDLTAYGALKRGVSRLHARLSLRDGKLYITDLGGANGTFVGATRLGADAAHELRNGDHILLGSLPIQILFD